MKFNNPWSFSGDEYNQPDGFVRRWCCAICAISAALLLAARLLCNARWRGVCDVLATASIWVLFLTYARQRHHALFVFHDPHKSIVATDFMLLGIAVSRTAQSLGAPRWLCSAWLRKYVLMTFATMYWNSGHSKLVNSGLAWFHGHAIYNLVLQFRSNSAWPWLSDKVLTSPMWWQIAGVGAFVFEVVLPITVLMSLLSFWSRGPWAGVTVVRVGLVLMATGFHVIVYLVLCPSFASFVQALVALGLDPIAWLSCESDVWEGITLDVDNSTAIKAATETSNKPAGSETCDTEVECNRKAQRLFLWPLASTWFLCFFTWLYVGMAYPQQDHHPLLPFTSMHMWSEPQWMSMPQMSNRSIGPVLSHLPAEVTPMVQHHELSRTFLDAKTPEEKGTARFVHKSANRHHVLLEIGHRVKKVEL